MAKQPTDHKPEVEVVDLTSYNLGAQSTCSSVNKNISKLLFNNHGNNKAFNKTMDKFEIQSQLTSADKGLNSSRDNDSKENTLFKYV